MAKIDWNKWFAGHPKFRNLADLRFLECLDPDADCATCAEHSFEPEMTIVSQHEPAKFVYFVGSGKAKVSIIGPDREPLTIAILTKGDFFGEMALLDEDDRPRSATVEAVEPCIVLEVEAQAFRQALRQHPDVFSEILLTLSERLRRLAERLAEVAYRDVNNKLQLMGAKIDGEVMAMNAALTASQKIFDQTTTWASEVLTSGERFWTRVTWAASIIGGGFTVLIAIAGYIGFQSVEDIKEKAVDIRAVRENVISEKTKIDEAVREIESQRALVSEAAPLIMLPLLFKSILSGGTPSEMRAAKALFQSALRSRDADLPRQVLEEMRDNVREKIEYLIYESAADPPTSHFEAYRKILSEAMENKDDTSISSRTIAISYYIYMITLLLDLRIEEYEIELANFADYVESQSPSLSRQDVKSFEAAQFTAYLESNEVTSIITPKIEESWAVLMSIR